jgi:threonine/homoserine/homoserine lactone efflux protein
MSTKPNESPIDELGPIFFIFGIVCGVRALIEVRSDMAFGALVTLAALCAAWVAWRALREKTMRR